MLYQNLLIPHGCEVLGFFIVSAVFEVFKVLQIFTIFAVIKIFENMARDITQAEKAALYYHLVGKCNDWEQLYKIAKGEEAFNKLSTASKSASVS